MNILIPKVSSYSSAVPGKIVNLDHKWFSVCHPTPFLSGGRPPPPPTRAQSGLEETFLSLTGLHTASHWVNSWHRLVLSGILDACLFLANCIIYEIREIKFTALRKWRKNKLSPIKLYNVTRLSNSSSAVTFNFGVSPPPGVLPRWDRSGYPVHGCWWRTQASRQITFYVNRARANKNFTANSSG